MNELNANYATAYGRRAGFGKKPALILIDFVQGYFEPNCDLYADVEQEFPNDDMNADNSDLYDDVLTAGVKVLIHMILKYNTF